MEFSDFRMLLGDVEDFFHRQDERLKRLEDRFEVSTDHRLRKLEERVSVLEASGTPPTQIVRFYDPMDQPFSAGYQREGAGRVVTKLGVRTMILGDTDDSLRCELRPKDLEGEHQKWKLEFSIPAIGNAPSNGYQRTILFQIHGGDNDGATPLLSVEYFLHKAEIRVYRSSDTHSYGKVASVPLVFDMQYTLEVDAFFSPDHGEAGVKLDGKTIWDYIGPFDYADHVKPPYGKYGIYVPSALEMESPWERTVKFYRVEVY